jgi:hypothetical protein
VITKVFRVIDTDTGNAIKTRAHFAVYASAATAAGVATRKNRQPGGMKLDVSTGAWVGRYQVQAGTVAWS